MTARKPRLLMCVFNPIEFDGRVQRSAESMAADYDVTLVSVHSGGGYRNPAFASYTVRLPARASKYAAHLRFGARVGRVALRLHPAVVYAHDYFMAFPGWIAAHLSGARFVYDAHELIIPEPGEALSARDALWYRLERAVVRRADLVVAANHERAQLMCEHYSLPAVPHVVRNIAAPPPGLLDDAEVLRRHAALRRARPDEVLAVYQGDMSLARGIGVFIAAAAQLPPNVRLVLVGSGPDQAALAALLDRPALRGRVALVGRVPRDHLYDILRLCDVGLIAYPMRGLNNVYCAPNKIFEYAQAGLPVVTTPQPPLRAALERYRIGEVVAADGLDEARAAAAWADAVRRVSEDVAGYRARLGVFLADHHWADDQQRVRRALGRLHAPRSAAPVGAGGP